MNSSETKKFLTEWNELFQMGYSDAQIEKDSQLLSKMTTEEKEEQRSLQVKVYYCELIQYEIQKLDNEQLYKMLVLIKNTIDQNKEIAERKSASTNNRSLFPVKSLTTGDNISADMKTEEKRVREMLHKHGFTGGHGIFSLPVTDQSGSVGGLGVCVCFCVPYKLDCMITILSAEKGLFFYKLKAVDVGNDTNSELDEVQLFTLEELERALETLK